MSIFSGIINLFRKKKSTGTVQEEKKVFTPPPVKPGVNNASPQSNAPPRREQTQYRRNPQGNYNKPNQSQTTAGNAGSSNKGTGTGVSNAGKYRNRRRYYNKPKDAQSASGPKPTQQQTPKPGQASSPQNNPAKPLKNEPEIKK